MKILIWHADSKIDSPSVLDTFIAESYTQEVGPMGAIKFTFVNGFQGGGNVITRVNSVTYYHTVLKVQEMEIVETQ